MPSAALNRPQPWASLLEWVFAPGPSCLSVFIFEVVWDMEFWGDVLLRASPLPAPLHRSHGTLAVDRTVFALPAMGHFFCVLVSAQFDYDVSRYGFFVLILLGIC